MFFTGSEDTLAISEGWETFPFDLLSTSQGTIQVKGLTTSVIFKEPLEVSFGGELTYKKRLHYIVDQLIPSYMLSDHPEWKILMEVFLKYMDERVYQQVMTVGSILNINSKNLTDQLIDELYNQFGKGLINEDLLKINTQDKRNFAQLGKFLNNLKGTKLSLQYLFKYLAQSQIIGLEEKKVLEYILEDVSENKSLLNIDENPNPKLFISPFTYNIMTNEVFDDIPRLLTNVHPAGFTYFVVYKDLLLYSESFSFAPEVGNTRVAFMHQYNGINNRLGYFNDGGKCTFSVKFNPVLCSNTFSLS